LVESAAAGSAGRAAAIRSTMGRPVAAAGPPGSVATRSAWKARSAANLPQRPLLPSRR
jgi:hypothetical protein